MVKKSQNQQWILALLLLAALGSIFFASSTGNFSLNVCATTPIVTPASAGLGQWKEIIWQAGCQNGVTELRYCPPGITCNDLTSQSFYAFSGIGTVTDYLNFDQRGVWQYYILTENGGSFSRSQMYSVTVGDPTTVPIAKDDLLITPCKSRRDEPDGSSTWRYGLSTQRNGETITTCGEINSNDLSPATLTISVLPGTQPQAQDAEICYYLDCGLEITTKPINKLLATLYTCQVRQCKAASQQ